MRRFRHFFALIRAGMIAFSIVGCATVRESPLELQVRELPQCDRDNVYPIFVESPVDIAGLGGMDRLADYVTENGFRNTQRFGFYADGGKEELADRIRRIKQGNPSAKVMLVGYSTGCVIVYNALEILRDDGICVESICYIDSFVLRRFCKGPHPENVGCISLIYRDGNDLPKGYPRTTVHRVHTSDHFDVPTHPHTVHVVLNHLRMHCGVY